MQTSAFTPMQPDLGAIWEQVARTGEAVELAWPGRRTMALLPADELRFMQETLYLLGSRANAHTLFDSMDQAERGEGIPFASVEELRQHLGAGFGPRTAH